MESGRLPMSHDLKGPSGGMGLIHRSLCFCFCFILYRSVCLQLIEVLPNFFLMQVYPWSNVSHPEESPPMKTATRARGLLQHCQLADRNFRDISSHIWNFSQDYCMFRLQTTLFLQIRIKSRYMHRLAKLSSWGWSETKKHGTGIFTTAITDLRSLSTLLLCDIYIYIYTHTHTHTKYTQLQE